MMPPGVDTAAAPAPSSARGRPGAAGSLSLVAEALGKSFERRPVLAELNLRVDTAQVLVVAGPNGAGKSTLLKLVAGLLRPTGGHVWLECGGARLTDERRRALTGYAAPDLRPYEELTAAENIDLIGRIRGVRREDLRVSDVLESVGLDPRSREPAGALSTGQRQRLKLALAGLGQPALLLLDEPGTNLDAAGRAVVARIIQAARRRGPVLLATNDPEEAQLGDRELRLECLADPHGRRR